MMVIRRLQELKEELQRLMTEEAESLKAQTFGGVDEQELKRQQERLKRIREISADLLAHLKDELI
jgi:hypothetical protein